MASRSMASELLSLVSPFNYQMLIPCLNADDFVPIKMFQRSQLGMIFNIDRSNCLHNGKVNNSHLFELFGAFSDEDAESVCSDTLEHINTGQEVYETVGQIFFAHREWNLIDWALTACSNYYYGDELLLFVLCRLFHRHAIVICRERNWSTLEPEGTMTTEQLLDACDLHLIYLRPGIFGELTLKKGKSTSMLTSSPPEFPAWSSNMVQGNILVMPGLEGFVDSELLKTYLNINDEGETLDTTANSSMKEVNINTDNGETIALNPNNSFAVNGGNVDVDVNSGNDETTMKSGNESLSLNGDMNGGNNESTMKGGNGSIILNGGNITNCLNSRNDEPIQTGENSASTIAYEDYDDEWSHTMDNHPNVIDIEVASPVSLKTSATQVLSMAMCVNKPMTLMHCCVTVISWNTNMVFPGNLTLPHLLFTSCLKLSHPQVVSTRYRPVV